MSAPVPAVPPNNRLGEIGVREFLLWMDSQYAEREWDEIHRATQRGRLIEQEMFQKQVEAMTGRR